MQLALVFVYLVLAAQFESFIDPFIILVSMPFGMFGAFLCLNALNRAAEGAESPGIRSAAPLPGAS